MHGQPWAALPCFHTRADTDYGLARVAGSGVLGQRIVSVLSLQKDGSESQSWSLGGHTDPSMLRLGSLGLTSLGRPDSRFSLSVPILSPTQAPWLLAHKIQSPQEKEALYALMVSPPLPSWPDPQGAGPWEGLRKPASGSTLFFGE